MGEFINNINNLIEYVSFFYVFLKRDFRKHTRYSSVFVYAFLIAGGAFVSPDLCKVKTIGPLSIFLIIVFVFLWETLDVTVVETVVWGIGQWLILTLVEMVFYVVIHPIVENESMTTSIISLLITVLCWLVYVITRNNTNVQKFKLPIRIWCIMDGILFVLTFMMIFFLTIIQSRATNEKAVRLGSVVLEIGSVGICVLLFWLMYSYNNINELKIKNEIIEKISAQQKEYFEQLLSKEEETRKFRHDIMNDLLQMKHYCEQKKYENLETYINNSFGIINSISQKNYDVGNDIVNVILNYYLIPVRDKYKVEIKGGMPDKLSIDERELSILMANIIKNATEAVDKTQNGYIYVNLNTGEHYISIEVKNSYDGQVVFDKKGMPVTSKSDKNNHGFGVANIADIVRKNGGRYNFATEKDVFVTNIFLKNDRLELKSVVQR